MVEVNDYVGMSFILVFMSHLATTFFLISERNNVEKKWKLPITVSAMVTGIAAYHYYFMKNIWLKNQENPVVYRYIDWFLTVPLQISEFYLILSVVNKIPLLLFFKLLGAAILMLIFGYLGETKIIGRFSGFTFGTFAWLYIIYEIFLGEAAKIKNETTDESVKFAFDGLKYIVTIGWAIYPIGYLLKKKNMNLLYNYGDFVNKILFALIIWYSAKKSQKQNNNLNETQ